MPSTTIKLAMGQMLVEGGDADGNLRRAGAMIARAAAQGCRIVVWDFIASHGHLSPPQQETYRSQLRTICSMFLSQPDRHDRCYLIPEPDEA